MQTSSSERRSETAEANEAFDVSHLRRQLLLAALLIFTAGLAPSDDGVPRFDGNTGWLNGPSFAADSLRGKVVLVDFWEYTCLNCLRTLPYLRAWHERYKNDGFVIVGVHTPEFAFSADPKNVQSALGQLDLTWPVVLDADRAIWRRYKNDGWPHEYLFDQNGHLVDSVAGEGRYPETEAKIQALLRAGNPELSLPPVMALLPEDSYDKPGALCYLGTPEMLLGHGAIANGSSFADPARDQPYSDPGSSYKDGAVYLQGLWHVSAQAAVSESSHAYVALRYRAVQVVSVLAPSQGKETRVDVTQDGRPVAKADAGRDIRFDVDGTSYITVDASRAYELVMNEKFGQRELRLTSEGYGLQVYSFAFESCEAAK